MKSKDRDDDHKPIFSAKELKTKSKMAFPNGIPNREAKIRAVREWQEMIRTGKADRKEEELKPIFLPLFFGEILGYDYKNAHKWHLQLENKSQTDSTKADAALGFFSIVPNPAGSENPQGSIKQDVRAVIEIKDSSNNLSPRGKNSAVSQAFSYVAKSGEKCKWVILSNFKQIHFYASHDATKCEKFIILDLDQEDEFDRFYYLLANGQLFFEKNISPVDTLLANRLELESRITQEFYEKYKHLREVFVQHLKLHNPHHAPLDLLQYAQTIIDRVIFVSVIKDYDLIRYNTLKKIKEISEESWANDQQEMWRQLKYLFRALDKGIPKRIEAFNGGLFRHNPVIDELVIKDVFLKQLFELNQYDFESELNINILGHIFEQSISDIENLKIELLQGKEVKYNETDEEIVFENAQNSAGLRKKDGIFYTPEYVTAYMIENSLGEWLEEQKEKIGLNEETADLALWERYQEILRNVKILDPACGSGAFLTQTFDFLWAEWRMVLEKIEKIEPHYLSKKGKNFTQIKKDIINNNLFGVDLNYESVEITKLGLWLKSASKSDPLALLDDNIKVGNSLISDPEISEKAFDWEKEFPQILNPQGFENLAGLGGFDLIVGNPPYVDIKTIEADFAKFYFENYQTAENRINLYALFIEKAYQLLKNHSILSFIVPNSLLVNSSYLKTRQLIYQNIEKIIKLPDNVFEEANVETIIFLCKKGKMLEQIQAYIFPRSAKVKKIEIENADFQVFNKKNWNGSGLTFNIYASNETQQIIKKCYQNSVLLGELCDFSLGITPYDKYKGHSENTIKNKEFHSEKPLDQSYKPLIAGENIMPYFISENSTGYIKYGDWLGAKREERFFTEPRIIVRQIVSGKPPRIYAGFTDKPLYFTQIGFSIIVKAGLENFYLLALLNSKLLNFIHKFKFLDINKEVFQKILIENCRQFPIKLLDTTEQKAFVSKVEQMQILQKKLKENQDNFVELLEANFHLPKISRKLEKWYELENRIFLQELEKQIGDISLDKQKDFFAFLKKERKIVEDLSFQIQNLEKEIDKLVYQLYDLTEDEIKIVENG